MRPARAAPAESTGDATWDLDALVRGLRRARHGRSERREALDRRERPSRDAVVEIVRNLRGALFPTHFGVSDFTQESIDFFVGSTLDTALRKLEEQVRRTLTYAEANVDLGREREARARVCELAKRLPAVRETLELDIRAAYDGDPAASSRAEVLFCYPGVTAITHHRIAHELYQLELPMLARMVAEIAHSTTGIDLHPGAEIGPSFFIDHGTGVVVGETAVIGEHVRLYQGVTLGARNFPVDARGALLKKLPRHPRIEDHVVIYAGATVLGQVTIGRGSVIGGNVWLTHDVPPYSHVSQAKTRYEPSARRDPDR